METDKWKPPDSAGTGAKGGAKRRGAGGRFRSVNRVFLVVGLFMTVIALFMTPVSFRNLCILINSGEYVQDSFDVEFLYEGATVSSRSLEGIMASSGERLVTKRIDLISAEQRKQLAGKGRFPGHQIPVRYLPRRGFWAGIDRILDFRLLSPKEFDMAHTIGLGFMTVNIAFGLGGFLIARRQMRRALKEFRSRKPL